MKNLITCLTVSVLSGAALATTWTVDDDGKADFDNIQAAVNAASDGDEIIVMPGTYTSTAHVVVDLVGKEIWLHSSGGAEVTIIDGEDAHRGIYCGNGETSNTIIEGLTIIRGFTEGSYPSNCGGGMLNFGSSSPTLTDCTFDSNTADYSGGGMFNASSSPTLTNCTFTNNSSYSGGGINNDLGSYATLTNCTFTGNTADYGGGMYNHLSSLTLTNCTFEKNHAFRGGGLYNVACSPTLTDCTFTGNSTEQWGGGMVNASSSNPTLTDCIFENNTSAAFGGGMYNYSSSPTLTNCTFENNTADYKGGGMYNRPESSPTLIDTIVCGNTVDQIYGPWIDGDGNCVAQNCNTCYPCPADWCVDDDGSVQFDNIQDAIDAASDGDEILVYPGTYTDTGNNVVDMKGKTVWLHSSDGPETTFIDGQGVRRGILCDSGETLEKIIEGFTITDGYADNGGGAHIAGGNPTFDNCYFTYNTAVDGGGVGVLENGIGTFQNCLFAFNTATSTCYYCGGGGFYQSGAGQNSQGEEVYTTFTECAFENNSARSGGGIFLDFCSATLDGCTMAGNTADYGDGVSGFTANYKFVDTNIIEESYFSDSVTLSYESDSSCTVNGNWVLYTHFCLVNSQFDINELNRDGLLIINGTMTRGGSLSVTNESNTLSNAEIGDTIPLVQAKAIDGAFDGTVVPQMPEGLGLQLIESLALDGSGTEIAIEVIETDGAEFDDPDSAYIWYEPVDLLSFDVDGDGKDEIAALFDGSPGYVRVYSVSENSAPSEITTCYTTVGDSPVDLDAGDINGDGKEDLVVANAASKTVSVLVSTTDNQGNSIFNQSTIGVNEEVTCVAIIDWDGDSTLDAVVGIDIVASNTNDRYQVLLDIATVGSTGPWFEIPLAQLPDSSVVIDTATCVDGGEQESSWGFVGGTRYGQAHRIKTDGVVRTLAETMGNVVTIKAMELDDDGGDGQIDLFAVSDEGESLYLFQGNTSGSGFDIVITLDISIPAQGALAIDADRDGDTDFVFAAPTSDTELLLLRNDGASNGILTGNLSGRTWSGQNMNSGNMPSKVASGNLDDKGEDDDWIISTGDPPNARDNCIIEQTNLIDITYGACCYANNTCVTHSATDCVSSGGTFQGDKTDCATVNCTFGDECTTAIPAMDGANAFDTTTMTPSTPYPDETTCADTYFDWGASADVWLSYVATGGKTIFDTCDATSYDTSLVLYDSCTNQVACNGDDITSPDPTCQTYSSEIIFTCTPNTTYIIRIGGWKGTVGDGTLNITPLYPPCPADFNDDGVVDVTDMLQLISAWGHCDSCPEDLDGDGEVAVSDVLTVIAAWGPCE